jgi:hypothetical protein
MANLNRKMAEIEAMTKTIDTLQEKITGLLNDNKTLDGDMRQGRITCAVYKPKPKDHSPTQRLQTDDCLQPRGEQSHQGQNTKNRQRKLLEMQTAEENLRLSTGQISKLNNELNEYKNQISTNNKDSEMFRLKIQKLLSENTSLGE